MTVRLAFAVGALTLAVVAAAEEPAEPAPLPDTIPVEAPAEPQPDAEPLDPITVTATRTAREVSAVPASVSVVDAFDIEGRGAATIGQAVAELAGVALEGGPRRDAEFINIRGLSGPRVMFLVDGARQNFYSGHRSSLLVEPELIERIEVLRGPASALWGSDAVGGVVSITTRDAADFLGDGETLTTRVRAGYDSAAAGKVTSSLAALRLGDLDAIADLSWREADDYRRGGGARQPDSASETLGSLVRLSWLPAGPHRLAFDYQGFRSDGLSPSNPAQQVDDNNPLLDRANQQRYAGLRYGFTGADGDALQAGAIGVYQADLDVREDRVDAPRRDATAFRTSGLHAQGSFPLPQDSLLTVGGEFFRDESSAERDGAPRPQFPDARRQAGGAFAQVEWPLGPVAVIPGLRYDRYAARADSAGAAVVESAVSPKLGLVWDVGAIDGLRLRVAGAEGFRAPSLVELYSSGQHFLGNEFTPNPGLRPERARNVETGVSWRGGLLGGLARLDASVYRNRIRDFIELEVLADVQMVAPQCSSPAPATGCVNRNDDGTANPAAPPIYVGGTTTSRNLTNATLRGGELQASYELGAAQLSVGYSRVRGADDASGEPLGSIPADTLRASLGYWMTPALRGSLGLAHALDQERVPSGTHSEVTVSPSTPFDALILSRFAVAAPPPAQPTPGYTTLNAALSWTPYTTAWGMREPRLVLGVDNATDAHYREHLNTLDSPGRNVRLSLSASF